MKHNIASKNNTLLSDFISLVNIDKQLFAMHMPSLALQKTTRLHMNMRVSLVAPTPYCNQTNKTNTKKRATRGEYIPWFDYHTLYLPTQVKSSLSSLCNSLTILLGSYSNHQLPKLSFLYDGCHAFHRLHPCTTGHKKIWLSFLY